MAPNDANLDTFSMMKWIEKTHEELNLELDTLPPEVVQACEKEGFKQELKAMKETEDAAKKVRHWGIRKIHSPFLTTKSILP